MIARRKVALSDLVEFENSKRSPLSTAERAKRPGPYPYHGAAGILDYIDDYKFDGLFVLVGEDGTVIDERGAPVLQLGRGKFWVSNHAHVIRMTNDIDTLWLYYALRNSQIGPFLSGSVQPKLSLGNLKRLEISVPDARERREIAKRLGALDDKIESNKRIERLCIELIDSEAAKFERDSQSVPLRELAHAARDSMNPMKFGDVDVDLYSLPAFDNGALPDRVHSSTILSNKLVLARPSVLVSRLNPRFDRTWWVVPQQSTISVASSEYAVIQAGSLEMLAGVILALRSTNFREEIASRVTGTSGSHQRVRTEDLLDIEVPDTRGINSGLQTTLLGILERCHSARIESQILRKLRDTLAPALLAGHMTVREFAS